MNGVQSWIGLFDVLFTERAQGFGEEGNYGAFVNAVAEASSETHFREIAAAAFDEDGFQVLDAENVRGVDLPDSGLSEDEHEHIAATLSQGESVAFGYFHCYPKEGLDG